MTEFRLKNTFRMFHFWKSHERWLNAFYGIFKQKAFWCALSIILCVSLSWNTNSGNGSSGGGGGGSDDDDDNDNGKNKREKNEAQPTEAASIGGNGSACCNSVSQAKKKQNTESKSRCCLALAIILCKIPNSTGLSTVDAKCQLYHKTKAVGKVHKQFCHSPFTLKCTYYILQIVCMRMYTSLGMNSQISKQRYGSILKFHNIPMLIIS